MIYLDHAASAPLLLQARRAMDTYYDQWYACANPNAFHHAGKCAARDLEQARSTLGNTLQKVSKLATSRLHPKELIFTRGGTESIHLALMGLAHGMRAKNPKRNTVIISELEHHAVSELSALLAKDGFEIKILKVTDSLTVDLNHLKTLLTENNVAVVSVMYAHNEIGVIEPIQAVGKMAHEHGALMHTDAVQAFCHLPLDLTQVDAASFAAHKLGGPRGMGLMYLRRATPCQPIMVGGGQEHGLRSGTQDVAGALGFAAAAQFMADHLEVHTEYLLSLRTHLLTELRRATISVPELCAVPTLADIDQQTSSNLTVNPGLTHLVLGGKVFDQIVMKLDEAGIAASSGSACTSTARTQHHQPSIVSSIMQARIPRAERYPLRISAGHASSKADMDALVRALVEIARSGRASSGSLRR